jgi:glutaredoxin 2
LTPYTDIEVTDKYIIREFNENIDPIELLWHRDNESRTIEILGETDWKVQLDNELPTSLNESIFIPRHIDMASNKVLLKEQANINIERVLFP